MNSVVLRKIAVSSAIGFAIGALLSVQFGSWWFTLVGALSSALLCEKEAVANLTRDVLRGMKKSATSLKASAEKLVQQASAEKLVQRWIDGRVQVPWLKILKILKTCSKWIATSIVVLSMISIYAGMASMVHTILGEPLFIQGNSVVDIMAGISCLYIFFGVAIFLCGCVCLFGFNDVREKKCPKQKWMFPLNCFLVLLLEGVENKFDEVHWEIRCSGDMEAVLTSRVFFFVISPPIFLLAIAVSVLVIVVESVDLLITLVLAVATTRGTASALGALVGGTIHYLAYGRADTASKILLFAGCMAISAMVGVLTYSAKGWLNTQMQEIQRYSCA